MEQLHLVGFTTELDGLIFSARKGAKTGGYLVAIDDRLLSLIGEAVRLRRGEGEDDVAEPGARQARRRVRALPLTPLDSQLSPRAIQARLRAGRSVAEVAAEAGVDPDWIMRFATPVLAEQAKVIERALDTSCRTQRRGVSSQPLATSLAWNLFERGLRFTEDEQAAGWSAYHAREGLWVVQFRYFSRSRPQLAQWEFDASTGSLASLNRLGSELGYVEPGRRLRAAAMKEVIAAAPTQSRAPAVHPPKKAAPKKAAPKKAAPKKAVRKKAAPKKVAATRVAPKKAVRKKAAPKKAVRKKIAATRVAPKKAVRRKAAATRAVPARAPRPLRARPLPPVARATRNGTGQRAVARRQHPLVAIRRRVVAGGDGDRGATVRRGTER